MKSFWTFFSRASKAASHQLTPRDLAELRLLCDRLTAELTEAGLERPRLLATARALEPLIQQVERAFKAHRAEHRGARETVLLDRALQQLLGCSYAIQPHHPWMPADHLQRQVGEALHSTGYAITALTWLTHYGSRAA